MSTLRTEDLKTMARIGRTLWADPAKAEPITADTVSAVTLQDTTAERAVDRAARVMLERATREGAIAEGTQAPFYRLLPEERFILSMLHLGRWSYARVGRLTGLSQNEVEETAWGIRLRLATLRHRRDYPVGTSAAGPSCPEYDLRRPWTQRFLDEEFTSGRELLFLQNHLMACDSCRRALNHARDLYYAVDSMLPRAHEEEEKGFLENLREIARQNERIRPGTDMTWARSFGIFFGRRKIQAAVLSFLVMTIIALARNLIHIQNSQ